MWLDRLSQSNSPIPTQGSNRAYSPLPRRATSSLTPYLTSQRSANTPRVSSSSLVSNDSSASLLSGIKKPNGTELRQPQTLTNGTESLELLNKLLGESKDSGAKVQHSITEDDLTENFDFAGLTLRDLALADESPQEKRPQSRIISVGDFEKDRSKYEDLHKSIHACDQILNSVETNLTSFRNDLAAVSADIETLQARSSALNVRLENRRAVEKGLGPIVEDLSVSPAVISQILEGHIDEAWIKTLADLDKRNTALKKNTSIQSQQNKATHDLGPLLERLTSKALERIRDFFVAQIKALRSPQINAQIIQQKHFLRFKDLFTFLHRHHDTLGDEICHAYMNTIRWYYTNQFTRYERALEKIKLHFLDKNDVLGHDESSKRTSVLSGASVLAGMSRLPGPPHDAFNIGRRIDILRTHNTSALPSYLAEEDQATHYLEMPFRNFNLALIDNVTAEYSFLVAFFTPSLSLATVGRHFNYIFEPTFALGKSLTKKLVSDSYDTLGLLLSIRLNQHNAFELQRRRIPAADAYVNGTNMLLWPRLQMVMSYHCDSVRTLTSALPAKPSTAVAKTMNTAPHLVTQRFGQMLHGILSLSQDAGDDEPVITSLGRLRSEVEAFLAKYSAGFGADKRKRERLLYNNYSLVLTIISDTEGKLAEDQKSYFEGLKGAFQEGS